MTAIPRHFSCTRVLFGLLLIALTSSLVASTPPSTLEKVLARGTLVAISRNGPTTYYEGSNGVTGFEYTLLQGFASYLGVKLAIKDQDNLNTMLDMVDAGQGDLAAAGLTITPQRKKRVEFTSPYLHVTQELVYNRDHPKPHSMADVVGGNLMVISGSSHVERLRQLKQRYPALTWHERDNLEMIDLLEMVHRGVIDYAIVDSNAYQVNAQTFPRAQVAFDLGKPEALGWAFPIRADNSLYQKAQDYLAHIKNNGSLKALAAEFFHNRSTVSTGGALLFANRVDTRLPRWKAQLQAAAKKVDMSWQLLAAISYQESHWNPKARSHTGVRGLMMLTRTTAREMGVSNRADPEQSIRGGAKYYRSLYDRLPERIQDPDRTYLALAAYNVGMSHLEDARILTERSGANPDKWQDVKKRLPLLAKRKYYRTTEHGYARGWEPVNYVRNIRQFRTIIAAHAQQMQRRLAMASRSELAEDTHSANKKSNTTHIMPMSVL